MLEEVARQLPVLIVEHGIPVGVLPLVQQHQEEHLRLVRPFRHFRQQHPAPEGNHRHPVVPVVAHRMHQACVIGGFLGEHRLPAGRAVFFCKQAKVKIPHLRRVVQLVDQHPVHFLQVLAGVQFDRQVRHTDFPGAQRVQLPVLLNRHPGVVILPAVAAPAAFPEYELRAQRNLFPPVFVFPADLAVQLLHRRDSHPREILFHRRQRRFLHGDAGHVVEPGHDHVLRHPDAVLRQRPDDADRHIVVGAGDRLRPFPAFGEKMLIGVRPAVDPHIPVADILFLVHRQPVGRHFLPVDLQALFTVRVSLVAGHEGYFLQPVAVQQVADQRAERPVFVRIHTGDFVRPVSDGHHRALRPFHDLRAQFLPEPRDLIGVRRDDDPVQLFDRGKGKHAPLLGVVIVLASEITDRGKNHDIVIQPLRFLFQCRVHRVVKQRVRLAQENTDRFPFSGNHVCPSPPVIIVFPAMPVRRPAAARSPLR